MKEISFTIDIHTYMFVGDKLNTRTLLVVLECLKECAFHIRTVYVNSLDPNGLVWRLGNPQFHNASHVVSWVVVKGLCGPHKLFGNFLISPLSAHGVKPYFHRM